MSIDSAYRIQVKQTDDDVVYTFEFESIEAASVRVFLTDKDGNRIEVPQVTEFES
jgi:hypothetical protein